MRFGKCVLAVRMVVGLAALTTPAFAQGNGDLAPTALPQATTPELSADDFMSNLNELSRSVRPAKFVSIEGVGSGTVAPGGMVFGSVSGTEQRDAPGSGADGSLSFGAGIGNANGGIGGQIAANITSVHPDDFADSGFLSAKLGTRILPSYGTNYAAVTVDGLAPWGDSLDMDLITSLAVTTFREITPVQNGEAYPLMLTAGVSSHGRDGTDPAPFLGAGIGLSRYLSTSVSYNGDYLNAGVGVKLPYFEGASASLTVNDLFDNNDRQRTVLAISFATFPLFGKAN